MCWCKKKQRAFQTSDAQRWSSNWWILIQRRVREYTLSVPLKSLLTDQVCPAPVPWQCPPAQAQVNFPSTASKLPSSSIKISKDAHQNAESSSLWVVKFLLYSLCFCALLEFFTINVSFMRHPKVVFKRYYHSLFFMCSHGDYTDRYLRGYLLKINVENTQLWNCPLDEVWWSGTLKPCDCLLSIDRYSIAHSHHFFPNRRQWESEKAAMLGNTAKVKAPIPQKRVNFQVS